MHKQTFDSLATTDAYWHENFEHGLLVTPAAEVSTNYSMRLSEDETAALNEHLARTGFFSSKVMAWGDDLALPRIVTAMEELKRKGWPSVFVFAYRAPWLLLERLFDFVSSVLGTDDLAIEPSVFAWLLDPPSGQVFSPGPTPPTHKPRQQGWYHPKP
jgi:hypothetical protein